MKALVLRVNAPDMSSYNGFQWPDEVGATVTAPDWSPEAECGNGLHGWLDGQGDGSASLYIDDPDARWLVVEVDTDAIVHLPGKVKFPSCVIRHIGDRESATRHLVENSPSAAGKAIIGGTATAGYCGTLLLKQWDENALRYRVHVAYVGEADIEPNVKYRLDSDGNFVKAETP